MEKVGFFTLVLTVDFITIKAHLMLHAEIDLYNVGPLHNTWCMTGERGNGRIKAVKSNSAEAIYFRNYHWNNRNCLQPPKILHPDEYIVKPAVQGSFDVTELIELLTEELGSAIQLLTTGFEPFATATVLDTVLYRNVKLRNSLFVTTQTTPNAVGFVENILLCSNGVQEKVVLVLEQLHISGVDDSHLQCCAQTSGVRKVAALNKLITIINVVPENLDHFVQCQKKRKEGFQRIQRKHWQETNYSGKLVIVPTYVFFS